MPKLLTEQEADALYQTAEKLESDGDYGCHVLAFKASEPEVASQPSWMCDEHFNALWEQFSPEEDIGTIVIDGDLVLSHEASISDRLMSLVVTGDLRATQLHIFETEVTVYGDLHVDVLTDHDDLVKVHGRSTIAKKAPDED
ncbi:MAG: hypothetical protein JRH20_16765 [Deltaproteobacteria bacterium]|nr:hypothetical protein [Deltaproteobacteria bacterium]